MKFSLISPFLFERSARGRQCFQFVNFTNSVKMNETDLINDTFNETVDDIFERNAGRILILSLGIPTWIYATLTVIGITTNITNIVIFSSESMRSPLNFLLSAMEMTNIVIFGSFIPEITAVYCPDLNVLHKYAFVNFIIIISFLGALSVSNWLTVTIGIFRFIAVTFPFAILDWCNGRRAKLALTFVVLFSFVFMSVYAYCNRTLAMKSIFDDMEYDSSFFLRNVVKGNNSTFVVTAVAEGRVAGYVVLFVTTVPCLCTGVLTCLLIRSLWKARYQRTQLLCTKEVCEIKYNCGENEERITITMLVVLLLLFLAYVPDSIVNAVLINNPDSEIGSTMLNKFARSRIGILVSNCMTFYIYYCMSRNFRKTMKIHICSAVRAILRPFRKAITKKV